MEELSVGDLVVSPTPWSPVSKISWLGSYEIDLRATPEREVLSPIRIERNALSDGVPHRDLFLSQDHALFIDGFLIRARLLVNDMSIVRADNFDSVTYWHVELERHGIVLAEGAAAESYLELNNRSVFTATLGHPREGRSPQAASFAWEGPFLDTVRRRLQLRAEASAFCRTQKPMPQNGNELTGEGMKPRH